MEIENIYETLELQLQIHFFFLHMTLNNPVIFFFSSLIFLMKCRGLYHSKHFSEAGKYRYDFKQ